MRKQERIFIELIRKLTKEQQAEYLKRLEGGVSYALSEATGVAVDVLEKVLEGD